MGSSSSSSNLTSLEPWLFPPGFLAEPWLSDAFARDTDALTKALTNSISSSEPLLSSFHFDSPSPNPETPRGSGQSITISGSGSDLEPVAKRKSPLGPKGGRVGKRKSRASKKSPTTFITADAENFRQMVQQVTGGGMFPGETVKPEAQRLGGRIQGCLPTLDTSSILLERHHQPLGPLPSEGEIGGGRGRGGIDISALSCFPTLDSWQLDVDNHLNFLVTD